MDYSENGVHWMLLGEVEIAQATSVASYASNTTVDLEGRAVQALRLTPSTNWGGMFPQFGLSEVRFTYIPTFARVPQPAHGDIDVPVDASLGWRAGREAAMYEVYLGTDTGSTVGDFDAPFAESTIVRSGAQSMPLAHDNSAPPPFYSEAQRDLGDRNNPTLGGTGLIFVDDISCGHPWSAND